MVLLQAVPRRCSRCARGEPGSAWWGPELDVVGSVLVCSHSEKSLRCGLAFLCVCAPRGSAGCLSVLAIAGGSGKRLDDSFPCRNLSRVPCCPVLHPESALFLFLNVKMRENQRCESGWLLFGGLCGVLQAGACREPGKAGGSGRSHPILKTMKCKRS